MPTESDKSRYFRYISSFFERRIISVISSGSLGVGVRGNNTSKPSFVIGPAIFLAAMYVSNHCLSWTPSDGRLYLLTS